MKSIIAFFINLLYGNDNKIKVILDLIQSALKFKNGYIIEKFGPRESERYFITIAITDNDSVVSLEGYPGNGSKAIIIEVHPDGNIYRSDISNDKSCAKDKHRLCYFKLKQKFNNIKIN